MVSIQCLIHFIYIKPADFAKNKMQNFEKNIYDFQKSTKKGEKAYIFGIFWEKYFYVKKVKK